MARLAAVVAVLLCSSALHSARSQSEPASIPKWTNSRTSRRLIVRYKDPEVTTAAAKASVAAASEVAAASMVAAAAAAGGVPAEAPVVTTRKLGAARGENPAIPGSFLLSANSAQAAEAVLEALRTDSSIQWAEWDTVRRASFMPSECGSSASSCQDTGDNRYWQVINTGLDKAWARRGTADFGGLASQGMIIDTGIQLNHDELAGVVDAGRSTYCNAGCGKGTGTDDNGHGTHCAGIFAAKHNTAASSPIGVMNAASIISCKFLDKWGEGDTSDAVDCINRAINSKTVSVISASWGGPDISYALGDAIQAACRANILVLVAAGNDNVAIDDATTPTYPANHAGASGFDCMIAVAASTSSNRLADFSNYGSRVQVAAPGQSIFSTYYAMYSTRTAKFESGTSMATPFAAAVGLALKNVFPSLTALQLKKVIIDSGSITPCSIYGCIGGKIINVNAALQAAEALTGSTPPPSVLCTSATCASNATHPYCSPSLGCVSCTTTTHCSLPAGADANCNYVVCSLPPGSCVVLPQQQGKTCPVPGMSATGFCNGQGSCVQCNLDSQCALPATADPTCNSGSCNKTTGRCSVVPAPSTRSCWLPGGSMPGTCNGNGVCTSGAQCSTSSQCSLPTGLDPSCNRPACNTTSGKCGVTPAPSTQTCTVAGTGAPGLCSNGVCAPSGCTLDSQCTLPAGMDSTCNTAVCIKATGQCSVAAVPSTRACNVSGSGAAGICTNGACTPGCLQDSQCSLPPGLDSTCNSAACNQATRQCSVVPAAADKSCKLAGSLAAGFCSGSGACVACTRDTQCGLPAGSDPACSNAVCDQVQGICSVMAAAVNKACSLQGSTGYCSSNATCVACTQDNQCSLPPGLDGTCALAVCDKNTSKCGVVAAPNNTSCTVQGLGLPGICSNTTCVQCQADTQCTLPPGVNASCNAAVCNRTIGRCGVLPLSSCAADPSGTANNTSNSTGCSLNSQCSLPAGLDAGCNSPVCDKASGKCSVARAAASTACRLQGGNGTATIGLCSSSGSCVQCLSAANCRSIPAGMNQQCTLGACTAGRCSYSPAPIGTNCNTTTNYPGKCGDRNTCLRCLSAGLSCMADKDCCNGLACRTRRCTVV